MEQTLVVTGASRGIGLATCLTLARLGHRVVGIARSFSHLGEGVKHELGSVPGSWLIERDLSVPSEVFLAAEEVRERSVAPVSVLVNNAGTSQPLSKLDSVSEDAYSYAFRLNVLAAHLMTQALLHELRTERGVVLNISSSAAEIGTSILGLGVYGTTKAALERLTASWALEEPELRFAAIRPGRVDTTMQYDLRVLHGPLAPTAATFRNAMDELRSPGDVGSAIAEFALIPTRFRSGSTVTLGCE